MTAPVAPLLTTRQRRIVEFIRAHAAEHGHCPSLREVADGVGLASVSAVVHRLHELKAAGWVSSVPGMPRTLRILNPADGTDT